MKRAPQVAHWSLLATLATLPAAHAAGTPEIVRITSQVFSTVSISGSAEGVGQCTGTFIHPRLVVTAAHCVAEFHSEWIGGIRVRETDMSNRPMPDQVARPNQVTVSSDETGDRYTVKRVWISPHASVQRARGGLSFQGVDQDLALIEVAQASPLMRTIAPQHPHERDTVYSVGFGAHGRKPSRGLWLKTGGANTVHMLDLGVIITQTGGKDVCANPQAHAADWGLCSGDSGGPLLDQRTGLLLGVASSTLTLNAGGMHSVFVDITQGLGKQFVLQGLQSVTR